MALKFKRKLPAPDPIPAPRVIDSSPAGEAAVTSQVRMAEGESNQADGVVDHQRPDASIPLEHAVDEGQEGQIVGESKLSRLIDDDFPFDESQLAAIEGVSQQQFACITGAAGTGKTTVTQAAVDRIKHTLGEVDMTNYFKKATPGTAAYDDLQDERAAMEDDDYVMPTHAIPSICLVGFTGRSTQMIKKNFPRDWHSNIMTIHRMLGFAPEFYEDYDPELDEIRNKMRFAPTYDATLLLPWDVIIIDEAGMVGTPLWDQLWAACKPGVRIIMIGDINQLPPVHGRSIFGFALSEWPSFELTTIHRQAGVNNSIVDNAWEILKGYRPKSDLPAHLSLGDSSNSKRSMEQVLETLKYLANPKGDWKFAMIRIPEDADVASQRVRKVLELLNGKFYDPIRDSVITAINGHDGSRGMNIGQIPMNRELAIKLNPGADRYIIDGGRERKQFAIGDKVMATKNDYEAGITNGMTGIIVNIERHTGYIGDTLRFGLVSEVNAYMADLNESDEDVDFSLDDVEDAASAQEKGAAEAKEGRDRGPASHVVTVKFGEGAHAFEIAFASLSEVASLMTAYVVTCHKMQGGESPLVMTILHQSHKSMLFREWGYTAMTRASQRQVFFYTDLGLRVMLNKQKITGKNLAEKVRYFQQLSAESIMGAAVKVNLPKASSRSTAMAVRPNTSEPKATAESACAFIVQGQSNAKTILERESEPEVILDRVVFRDRVIILTERVDKEYLEPEPKAPKDGGDAIRTPRDYQQERLDELAARQKLIFGGPLRLETSRRSVVPSGPVITIASTGRPKPLLLTHQPAPEPVVKTKRFGVKR